jgi:hypothetical protein
MSYPQLYWARKNLSPQYSLPVIKVWEHETSVCSCLYLAVPVCYSNYAGVKETSVNLEQF